MKEDESMGMRGEDRGGRAMSAGQTKGKETEARMGDVEPARVMARIPQTPAGEVDVDEPSAEGRPWRLIPAPLASAVLFVGALALFIAALVVYSSSGNSDTASKPAAEKTAAATEAPKWIGAGPQAKPAAAANAKEVTPASTTLPTWNIANPTAGREPPTAAWGGQPQWPMGDRPATADQRALADKPATTWPNVAAQAGADRNANPWPSAGSATRPADNRADRASNPNPPAIATQWNGAPSARESLSRVPAWVEPSQPPAAVPAQGPSAVVASRNPAWERPSNPGYPTANQEPARYGLPERAADPMRQAGSPVDSGSYRPAGVPNNRTEIPAGASQGGYVEQYRGGQPYSPSAYPATGRASDAAAYPSTQDSSGYSRASFGESAAAASYLTPQGTAATNTAVNAAYQGAGSAGPANYPNAAASPAYGAGPAAPYANLPARTSAPAYGGNVPAYNPASAYGAAPATYPAGGAQFQGTIDPSTRSVYDRAGSSIR